MKQKRLIIHIGIGKTGTTSIQVALDLGRDLLLDAGFLYPKTGLAGSGHHLLSPLDAVSMGVDVQGLYLALCREINASTAHTVIISSEFFSYAQPSFIEEIKSVFFEYDVTVVFYVREQVGMISSTFLQWQKIGEDYKGTVDRFFLEHKGAFDYMARIQPWVNAFGPENIIARVYDKAVIGNDVVKDFAMVCGLGDLLQSNGVDYNPSLRPEFSKLVSMIDDAGVNGENRMKIIDELLKISVSMKNLPSPDWIPESLKAAIRETYGESNRQFAEQFLPEDQRVIFFKATGAL